MARKRHFTDRTEVTNWLQSQLTKVRRLSKRLKKEK